MNKIMDTLHYDCINECADNIFHIYNELTIYDDLANINIIAKYNEAKKFVERFIRLGFDIVSISELSEADINGYNDEYVIALDRDGLWCTPAKYEDKYLYVKADVVYILDNCCSKVIPNICCIILVILPLASSLTRGHPAMVLGPTIPSTT